MIDLEPKSQTSFYQSVQNYFDKAAIHTDLHPGLLAQIKVCNAVYQVHFPVKVKGEYRVIEAYSCAAQPPPYSYKRGYPF